MQDTVYSTKIKAIRGKLKAELANKQVESIWGGDLSHVVQLQEQQDLQELEAIWGGSLIK